MLQMMAPAILCVVLLGTCHRLTVSTFYLIVIVNIHESFVKLKIKIKKWKSGIIFWKQFLPHQIGNSGIHKFDGDQVFCSLGGGISIF